MPELRGIKPEKSFRRLLTVKEEFTLDIEVVRKEKNVVEFILKGERHTYPNILKSALLEDSNVEFVSYVQDHPEDDDSRFVVRTKKSTPKKALEDAAKKIESDIKAFDSAVKKAFK